MNKIQNEFLRKCQDLHTTTAVFISLFCIWSKLSAEERGEVIEFEEKSGRLEVDN